MTPSLSSARLNTNNDDNFELQRLSHGVALPADYEDPSHPHFPGNVTTQSGQGRRSCIFRYRWMAISIILFLVALASAVLIGKRLVRRISHPRFGIPSNTTNEAVEWHTVTLTITKPSTSNLPSTSPFPETHTTWVTSRILETITTVPETTSQILSSAVSTSDGPQSASSSSALPVESSAVPDGGNGCIEVGTYQTGKLCNDHCGEENGKVKTCEARRGFWTCRVCKV